jgi:hypothetical protein
MEQNFLPKIVGKPNSQHPFKVLEENHNIIFSNNNNKKVKSLYVIIYVCFGRLGAIKL